MDKQGVVFVCLWAILIPVCFAGDRHILDKWDRFPIGCKLTPGGHEYAGNLTTTTQGKTCQAWNTNRNPHYNYYVNSQVFPEASSTGAGNRCRNPNYNWNMQASGPWCYTTDRATRWQICAVDFCECKVLQNGTDYQGRITKTVGNYTCQRWNRQTPHSHPYVTAHFPESHVYYAKNYCRNPNVSRPDGPWCYTTNSQVEWQYCNVPICNISWYYRPTTTPEPTTTTTVSTTPTTTTTTPTTTTPTTTTRPTTTTQTTTHTTIPTATTTISTTTTTTPPTAVSTSPASTRPSTTARSPQSSSTRKVDKSTTTKAPGESDPRGEGGKTAAASGAENSGLGVSVGVPVAVVIMAIVVGIVLFRKRESIKACLNNSGETPEDGMDNPVYDTNSEKVQVSKTY